MCDEYSFDCGDCGGEIIDENGYCDDNLSIIDRFEIPYLIYNFSITIAEAPPPPLQIPATPIFPEF